MSWYVSTSVTEGKHYRYSYGFCTFAGEGEYKGDYLKWAITKQDHGLHPVAPATSTSTSNSTAAPTTVTWTSSECYPSEVVFVPNPARNGGGGDGAGKEDDGVLLSQVYDGHRREAFLLMLNATDMTELSRSYTGVRSNINFHGAFIPSPTKEET
jgi:carotenoid cleavage dioxygenase-like enzyme